MCHAPICQQRELKARLSALADRWEADDCWPLAADELRALLGDQ